MSLLPGEVFAGFIIERELGAGGMGVVYLARHPRLPRRVALKLLRTDLGADPSFVVRFQREAETVARLDHPNIVAIDDSGAESGALWISMRFIDGTTAGGALAEYEAGMPPERAVHIIEKVAAALDYAHRHNIVHRDVKPANILLTETNDGDEERVYLTDFGVAKAMGEIEAQATALTTAGGVVATLDYAAPEQIEGKPLDGRCDIYALGCVLYKLLTGVIPFPGETLGAKVYARMHRPPPAPSATVPTLPPNFDAVVAKALALDPADRYQTCRAFAAAARAALGQAPSGNTSTERVIADPNATEYLGDRAHRVSGPTTGPSTPPPGAQYAQNRPGTNPGSNPNTGGRAGYTTADSLPPDLAQFLAPGLRSSPGASPSSPPHRSRVRQRSALAIGAVLLVAAIVVGIALIQKAGIGGTAALRGENSTLASTPVSGTAANSGTASSAASSSAATSETTTTTATTPTTTTTPTTSASAGPKPVAGLPHSTPLPPNIIVVSRLNAGKYALYPMNADTGQVGDPITEPTGSPQNPLISSERGSLIYLQSGGSGNTIRAVAANGDGDRVLFQKPDDCPAVGRPAWNPTDQTELAIACTSADGQTDLRLVTVTGKFIRTLDTTLVKVDDLSFSKDGKLLTYWGSADKAAGGGQLYTQKTDDSGEAPKEITTSEFNDADPDFSPDGSEIAFRRSVKVDGKNYSQIAVVSVDGGDVQMLTEGNSNKQGPCWSPDGTRIAYKDNARPEGVPAKDEIWVLTVVKSDGHTVGGKESRSLGQDDPGAVRGSPAWGNR